MNAATTDRCWINNGGFALDGKTHMTGAQIRALPLPSIRDTDDLYMEVPGSEDVLVEYDEVVPVIGRRFFSVPSIINAGAPASDAASSSGLPFYQDDRVTLWNDNVRYTDWPAFLHGAKYVVVTDPPYPNNAGHFNESVNAARELLACVDCEALVFWSELEKPPVPLPLVAVHIWHRSNVNGRPYEPIYHFHPSGVKRRSEVFRHPAIFGGAGPGCNEYLGHPTQKPVALMRRLIEKVDAAIVLDPFAGSGSTLRAAKDLDRKAVGFEVVDGYCEIAAKRLGQEVLNVAA